MVVLTEECDKEKKEGREKNEPETSEDPLTNRKCGVWGPRGGVESVAYSTGKAISE